MSLLLAYLRSFHVWWLSVCQGVRFASLQKHACSTLCRQKYSCVSLFTCKALAAGVRQCLVVLLLSVWVPSSSVLHPCHESVLHLLCTSLYEQNTSYRVGVHECAVCADLCFDASGLTGTPCCCTALQYYRSFQLDCSMCVQHRCTALCW